MSEGRAGACASLLDRLRSLDHSLVEQFNADTNQMGADYDDRIRFLEARTLILGDTLASLLETLSNGPSQ